ncbi:S-layer homology domain-containing protein [uncultured Oscillibacter sp.]|uniref:S-layer homology domain-containing protein n=1 Tax=uncultured Oscillibacter sp. TaxID=876091 RepID=UPI00280BA523|nr:S-layer homology domain-containing protein [uncultured Oscillibacter sp.]
MPADAYYADAVAWAVEEGITSGIGANSFSPDAPCTRAQIVTFLYRDSKDA